MLLRQVLERKSFLLFKPKMTLISTLLLNDAQHFLGTSTTAFQFCFIHFNLDNEILCNAGIEFTSNMTDISSKKLL